MLQEPVPCEVKELLENQQLNGVPVLLSTTSDLSLIRRLACTTGSSSPATIWLSSTAQSPAWFTTCRSRAWRSSALRARSAPASCRPTSTTPGSMWPATRTRWRRRFHKLADKLEDLRTERRSRRSHPDEQVDSTHCPKCGLRLPTAGESCPRCLPRKAIVARLWQLLRPQWPTALGMCGLMLVGVAMELAPPKLQQYLVDDILTKAAASPNARSLLAALLLVVLALAATRVLLGVVNWVKGLLANKVGVALTFELRSQLVRKLHALGVGYYDRHQVGSLVSRVAYDSEVLHGLLQQITGGFLLQIVQVVAVGVMLFTLNPKLALYTLIPAPLVVGGSLFFWRRVYPNYYRYWDSSSKQAGTLSGMLSGVRVVKAFAQEPREFDRFQPLQRLPASLPTDRRQGQRLVHRHHGADLQPGRPDRLVRRRTRRAGRQDDARFADGVPRLPGHVLRAAFHAVATHDLAHQLHDRLPARLRAARHARSKRNDPPSRSACRRPAARSASKTSPSATSAIDPCSRTSTSRFSPARRSASSAAAAAARRRS